MTAEESADLQVRLCPELRQVPVVTLQRSFCLKECRLLKKIYACLSADLRFECGCTQPFAVAAAGIRLLVERLELDR